MSIGEARIRAHIFLVILEKFSNSAERRQEALADYLLVTLPNISTETAGRLASLIPNILPELYSRWIGLFADRLLETIPRDQLLHLCSGGEENDAALSLVFLMFMESERMERQMEGDLRQYAREHSGAEDMGDLVAAYLRGKVEALRTAGEK